jgi:signal transduction histidine kinase
MNAEYFSVNDVINDMLHKYQILANAKGLVLEMELTQKIPNVYADVALIERVLQNLIENAIKYSKAAGKILVRTSYDMTQVKVEVIDTGIGIPLEEQEKIFSRYYKGAKFKESKSSTGLGLAIVKMILDLHESPLELKSEVHVGSTFSFFLKTKK